MDIERGNIEILFQKINYMAVGRQINFGEKLNRQMHSHKNIDKMLYMQCAEYIFPYMNEDERANGYSLACTQMKDVHGENPSVFRLITDLSKKLLRMDGDEIRCRFEQLLRWREISLPLGQDIFTCAFLADYDAERGFDTKNFSWVPIILSDNDRLHHILNKGMAENHFHLAGSTKVFELNWLSLMNQIEGRLHDFKKMNRSLQNHCIDPFHVYGKKESFYAECQRAALYRVYLFSVIKEDDYLIAKLEGLLSELWTGIRPEELVSDLQDAIMLVKNVYGARLNDCVLDYALEKNMINENANECRLLAGERKFLYTCFQYAASDLFTDEQKDLFYAYLVIRTDFRGEIIQTNHQVGFANFSNYQDRKEYFIEGKKAYEDELVRLALNECLQRQNIVSLEARICPKNTSLKLYQALKNYEYIVKNQTEDGHTEEGEKAYSKLKYVLHFPKLFDEDFVPGVPRNDNVRTRSARQAKSIVALLEKRMEINNHLKGIDACSSELACRPEVFGQVFRYLSDTAVICRETQEDTLRTVFRTKNLHTTYHAGEDFFDIVDGLRAIDEAVLFCGLKRGSRLGHALALGIDPDEYYKFKGQKLMLSKQTLLDDIVWMLCKAEEFGCQIEGSLKSRLERKYYDLYDEIFRSKFPTTVHDYYQSWKLRGDKPELYRENLNRAQKEQFQKKITDAQLERFDRYQINDRVGNDLRKNYIYRYIYASYHFDKQVRIKGSEITEFKVGQSYSQLVRELQDSMIRQLVGAGIGIETNPSSNYLIGTIRKYEEHPILRFNARKLKAVEAGVSLSVSINTDDQGVFDTLLENEYALMALALKKAKEKDSGSMYDIEDVYEWIDYVRRMGIEQVFM